MGRHVGRPDSPIGPRPPGPLERRTGGSSARDLNRLADLGTSTGRLAESAARRDNRKGLTLDGGLAAATTAGDDPSALIRLYATGDLAVPEQLAV